MMIMMMNSEGLRPHRWNISQNYYNKYIYILFHCAAKLLKTFDNSALLCRRLEADPRNNTGFLHRDSGLNISAE